MVTKQEITNLLHNATPEQYDRILNSLKWLEPSLQNGQSETLPEPKHFITAERDTLIKAAINGSKYLSDSEKISIKAGYKLGVMVCKYEKDQHCYIQLPNNHEGYIYRPHWNLGESLLAPKSEIFNGKGQLQVPYYRQRDNSSLTGHRHGSRQCNLTSNAMLIDTVKPGTCKVLADKYGFSQPEDGYGKFLYNYGDTIDHDAQTRALKALGIDSYFTRTASLKDCMMVMDKGIPIVAGVDYKSDGHILVFVGYDDQGFWAHDPYGIRTGYSDAYSDADGSYDFLTYDWLQVKFVDKGSEAGWARFVTHVDGKATGVPTGL